MFKTLIFLAILKIAYSNDCGNSARIIFDGDEPDFSLRKTDFGTLRCVCCGGNRIDFDQSSRIFSHLKRIIQTHPRPTKLVFENCKFSEIDREIFRAMRPQKPIKEIIFTNGTFNR